jgi:hypothetical protein
VSEEGEYLLSKLGITKVISLLPHGQDAISSSGVDRRDEEMVKIHQELHMRKRMNFLYKLYNLRKNEVRKGAEDQGLDPNTYSSFINFSSVKFNRAEGSDGGNNFKHLAAMSISTQKPSTFFNTTNLHRSPLQT